jgi:hypothetical protein
MHTANAVATEIDTHSLDPHIAVVWSGFWNLLGVVTSSGLVALWNHFAPARRRENWQGSLDLRPGSCRRTHRDGHNRSCRLVRIAGEYNPRSFFRGGRHHDGKSVRATVVHCQESGNGMGIDPANLDHARRISVLGIAKHLLSVRWSAQPRRQGLHLSPDENTGTRRGQDRIAGL